MKAVLLLLVVTLAEATIGIFVKLTDGQVPILALNFYRVFFAALLLWPLVAMAEKGPIVWPRHNLRDIAIIGGLIALQISLFNYAMTLTTVANAVVFWSVAPFFVGIFSTIFLKERPRPVYGLIFLLALVGIVVAEPVSWQLGAWSAAQLGNVLALATGAVYAAVVTYIRSEGKTETRVDVLWFMIAACIYLAPTLLISGWGDVWATSTTTLGGYAVPVLLWVIGLGMFSTGLAYFCMSYVLKNMSANIYSLIDIIVSPVIAALFAWFIFREMPTPSLLIGGAVLLLSGAILTLLRNHQLATVQTKEGSALPGR